MSNDEQPTSDAAARGPVNGSELAPNAVVNGVYRLVRRLGAGGMGEVWEARHERTRGRVAVKVLLPEMGRHEDVLRRFQREVEITSALNHPNIVRVSDADKLADGRPFLVMEFLEGSDLATSAAAALLSMPQLLDVIDQIALGLQAAHGHAVVHRDLKPANIFLVPLPGTTRVVVKILDFGISKALDGLSKLTHTRSIVGTPYYMAPEQARAGISSLDARADQFSLAAIAYELVTGRMAFDGDGMVNVLYKVVQEPPPSFASLGVRAPAGVETVLLRGLSKQADDRYVTVLEFSEALRKAAGVGGVERNSMPRAEVPVIGETRPLPATPVTTLNGSTGEIDSVGAALRHPPSSATDPGEAGLSLKSIHRLSRVLMAGGAGVLAVAILVVAISRRSPPAPAPVAAAPRPAEVRAWSPPPPVTAPAPGPEHDKIVIGSDGRGTVIPAGEGSHPPRIVGASDDPHRADSPAPTAADTAAKAGDSNANGPPRSVESLHQRRPPKRILRAGGDKVARTGDAAAQTNQTKPIPAQSTGTGAVPAWKDPFVDDAAPRPAASPAPEMGKAKRTTKAIASDTQAHQPAAKTPTGKTARQPPLLNSDL